MQLPTRENGLSRQQRSLQFTFLTRFAVINVRYPLCLLLIECKELGKYNYLKCLTLLLACYKSASRCYEEVTGE